ncbi:MAG: IclR family transcriptional regulator [Candidatus Humimicrobiaceae bacterium]
MKESSKIKSIEKAFKVLDIISNQKDGIKLRQIAQEMMGNESALHHLLSSLLDTNIIVKNPTNNRYYLGIKTVELGNKYFSALSFYDIAKTHLERLINEFNESVYLVTYENNRLILLESMASDYFLKSYISVKIEEAHATACGKILLSEFSEQNLKDHIKKYSLTKLTEHTIIQEDKLIEELKSIKKNGYSLDNEELEVNLNCIGVPIYSYKNKLVSTIVIAIPKNRLTDSIKEKMINSLKKASIEISGHLGYKFIK